MAQSLSICDELVAIAMSPGHCSRLYHACVFHHSHHPLLATTRTPDLGIMISIETLNPAHESLHLLPP